ncbi:hypothetical protein V496_05975 [Pseudogymnoascus sp. VKM F-4515 (FW-2607)]|nr:hypothetical protein V496_05975 [Pseudogymnoascus sp. VKM F-4515 (FW-2607)]KFY90405.1 hypothetical protein V498_05999 [Pseudogymnoascus sp. VKM F-4517 (FW-2822)]
MVRNGILVLFERVSLPYDVTGLVNECYWLADIKMTFDLDTVLAIEQSTKAMDLTHNLRLFYQRLLPNDASAWDKHEIRKLLQAATTEDGEWNASIRDGFWKQCKAKNHSRSLIISDTGLIGKVEAGRKEAIVGDILTSPLLLRPVGNDYYVVVAGAMIPDLCDSVSILGPLPDPWKMQFLDLPGHPEA